MVFTLNVILFIDNSLIVNLFSPPSNHDEIMHRENSQKASGYKLL